MPDFKINDESFQALVAQQILATISEETKDSLVQEAIKFLMHEENTYGRKLPSPLAQAFQDELIRVARRIATEVFSEEVIQAQVEKQVEEHIRKAIEERGFDLSYVIGQAIGQNLEVQFKSP